MVDVIGENKEKKRLPVSPINGQPVPGGRTKGVPNKATGRAREAIAQFVDGNADRLVVWLDEIAKRDPEAAFKCFMSVVEYHIPKLQRDIISGDPENPLINKIVIEVVKPRVDDQNSNP